jgi:antitoxin component of RelBE/YafQ-DinJ toxin-antitoxin module
MNYMEQYPVRIGVRLDEETRDKLQERISGLGISASAYIRMLLNETLNQKR